ncbi:hypothetical protein D9M71_700670 [compost metagenome]
MAGVEQLGDAGAEALLGGIQVAVIAADVAGIEGRAPAVPGQVGQQLADRRRRARGADAALVAAHALVAGEAEQGQARLAVRAQRLDALVPARAVGFGVDAAAPGVHGQAINVHSSRLH